MGVYTRHVHSMLHAYNFNYLCAWLSKPRYSPPLRGGLGLNGLCCVVFYSLLRCLSQSPRNYPGEETSIYCAYIVGIFWYACSAQSIFVVCLPVIFFALYWIPKCTHFAHKINKQKYLKFGNPPWKYLFLLYNMK